MWKYKGNELSSAKNCSGDVWEHKIPTTATKRAFCWDSILKCCFQRSPVNVQVELYREIWHFGTMIIPSAKES